MLDVAQQRQRQAAHWLIRAALTDGITRQREHVQVLFVGNALHRVYHRLIATRLAEHLHLRAARLLHTANLGRADCIGTRPTVACF